MSRHAWLLARGGILRWRLETFGLYMPSLPDARPWWRVNGKALLQLCRQSGPYTGWVVDMRTLRVHGSSGWWQARLRGRYRNFADCIDRENDPRSDEPDAVNTLLPL